MFHGRAVRMDAAVDGISRLCNPLSRLARANDRTGMQGQRNQNFLYSSLPMLREVVVVREPARFAALKKGKLENIVMDWWNRCVRDFE